MSASSSAIESTAPNQNLPSNFEAAALRRERANFIRFLGIAKYSEILAAVLFAISMASQSGWNAPLIWLGAILVPLILCVIVLMKPIAALKSSEELAESLATTGSAFSNVVVANSMCGLLWGLSVFYLVEPGNELSMFIASIWLIGLLMSSLGMAALSCYAPLLWGAPIFVCLMVKLLSLGELVFNVIALGTVILMAFFVTMVVRTRDIVRRDFLRDLQKAALVERLADANRYAEQLNSELRMEIKRREKVEQALIEERDHAAHLCTIDSLTGIHNRRAFDSALEEEIGRARRNNHPLSLIIIDVDRFKNYNDARGHQAGDDVLRRVANIIETVTRRGTDMGCRYGGEEFTVLLPNTELTQAFKISESIRFALENEQIDHPDSDVSHFVTVSVGVSAAIPDNATAEKLLHAADKALYAAKSAGRNITFSSPPLTQA